VSLTNNSFAVAVCFLFLLGPSAKAWQPKFEQRGFVEWRSLFYVEEAPGDAELFTGQARARWEGSLAWGGAWAVLFGLEATGDTYGDVRRDAGFFWFDRSLRRPVASLRRLSLRYNGAHWTFEAGKQVIRWGQTDLWSPADRFAPRDLLYPLDPEYMAVTAARASYRNGNRQIEAVYVPRFTPGRLPLPGRRWLQISEDISGYEFRDIGNVYPGGGQFGARFRHDFRGTDYALTYFDGFNHTPSQTLLYNPFTETIKLRRDYPRLRMAGGDFSRATPWLLVRGEVAWFTTTTPYTDDYVQYVIEGERTQGPVTLIAGYTGERVIEDRAKNRLALDRALAHLFLGRIYWNINARNDVKIELLARRTGDLFGIKSAYSRRLGEHWRVTVGFAWLRGEPDTAIGQYNCNSHATLGIRYSF
jgi:hypothetical protein